MRARAPIRPARRPGVALAPFLVPLAFAGPLSALDLALPDGAVTVEAAPPVAGSHAIATGPWREGQVPLRDAIGLIRAATWHIPATSSLNVDIVAAGFEEQLRAQGYEIGFACNDRICGGFDFRLALDMGQSPEMHVDIGNFRYVTATGPEGEDAVAITVSRGARTLYVHAVRIGGDPENGGWVTQSSRTPSDSDPGTGPATDAPPLDTADAILALADHGAVPLDDLSFRTGASELSGRDYPSLVALATFLAENPDRRVVLVGHTDAEGRRDSNLALSEARAEAVRRHLIDALGVDPAQLDATGIGVLAPRATNETPEGREANRRVEVVLLSEG